jgi:hypothetical protein
MLSRQQPFIIPFKSLLLRLELIQYIQTAISLKITCHPQFFFTPNIDTNSNSISDAKPSSTSSHVPSKWIRGALMAFDQVTQVQTNNCTYWPDPHVKSQPQY